MRKIALGVVTVGLVFAGPAQAARRLTRAEVMRAASAYARSVDPGPARINCHRTHCHIAQNITEGEWNGWQMSYRISVTRIGPHRIRAASPFMKPDVVIRG